MTSTWLVKLTTRKMGMQCRSCRQSFELEVIADSSESAVAAAKKQTGLDPDTHQFSIEYVRSLL